MEPSPRTPGSSETLPSLWVAAIFAVTFLAHSWVLALPFQLDDYDVLRDPLALFGRAHFRELDFHGFMMRWPMWIAFWLVELLLSKPYSPVPFHVVGLLLHATTAVCLARLVVRAERPFGLRGAGAFAGLAFALAGGHMQAVSWTAAWSSLLYTLFGLLGLEAFLRARACSGLRATLLRTGGAFAFWLAITTKAPAIVVPAAAAVVLCAVHVAGRASGRPWRRELLRDALFVAGGVGAGLVARRLFLGSAELRYWERPAPELFELLAAFPNGLAGLGQALVPWNRDPLFAGEGPFLARALGVLGAPRIALLVFAPIVVASFALIARWRVLACVLFVALVPTLLPPGMLYDGAATNVVSRTVYLPMAVTCALLGCAFGAAWNTRALRRGAIALAAVAIVTLVDGTLHVAHTETAMAQDQAAIRAEIQGLVDEHGTVGEPADLLVLCLLPDSGFAGIPNLGDLLPLALEHPFVPSKGPELRTFFDTATLQAALLEDGIARRDVVVLGPEVGGDFGVLPPDPALDGAANRERRRMRRLTPIRYGLAREADLSTLAWSRAETLEQVLWTPERAVPAHAAGALELSLGALPFAGTFTLEHANGTTTRAPVEVRPRAEDGDGGSGGPHRLTLELPTGLAQRLAAPITGLVWTANDTRTQATEVGALHDLRLLEHLPEVELVAPEPGHKIPVGRATIELPHFTITLPNDDVRPRFARLELRFDNVGRPISLFADTPVPPTGSSLDLTPARLHDGSAPPPAPGEPWDHVARNYLLPELHGDRFKRASFAWRVTLFVDGDLRSARSAFRPARFAPPASD